MWSLSCSAVGMMKMKKIGLIIGIAVLGAGTLLLIPILQQRPYWPKVADPNALLGECTVISATAPAGQYAQQKWGPAIQALHPRFVLFEDKRINIVLSTGGIGDSWGLYFAIAWQWRSQWIRAAIPCAASVLSAAWSHWYCNEWFSVYGD